MESSTTSGVTKFQSCFQIAEVTQPLVSASRVCGQGLECQFNKTEARVLDKSGKTLVTFQRQGGLYISKMRLSLLRVLAGLLDRLSDDLERKT